MTMDHLYIRVNTDKVSPLVITEIAPGVNAAWSKVGNEKTLVGVEIIAPVVSILLNGTTLYPSPPAQEGEAVIEQRHRHAAREIWNRIVNSSSATRDVEVIAATLASCERSVRDEFRACGLADKDGKPLKRILPDCEDACTYDEMHGMMHDALGKIQEFIDAGLADAEGKPRVALEIRGTKEHDIFTFAALPAGRGEAP